MKRRVNRRTFLKGSSGALMLLPFLEADETKTGTVIPKRMVATGVFYGLMPHLFFPKQTGSNYDMPRTLKPLTKLRNDFTVFNGLDHSLSGGHEATKYFLSGIPLSQIKNYKEANISVDQKAAQYVGTKTRFPSLSLGCNTNNSNYLSWTRHGSQVRPVSDLETLYELLFKAPNQKARKDIQQNMASRESVLDLVRDQAKSFSKDLGKPDREKLDQYFTSVRELENKVEQSRLWLNKPKPATHYKLPGNSRSMTLKQQTPLFYDLMALALQTDSTRVITLSFSNLGSSYGGIPGVSHDYHTLSHHGQEKKPIDELALVETFLIGEFANFLTKLKAVKEPNGKTLLDNTMAIFGSGMSNANSHSNKDLPVILAGGGFKHGSYKNYKKGKESTPLTNLYLSMLQNFGLEINQFNTSSGTLSGLDVKS